MKPGDLVRVAQRFSGNWGSERVPIFNDGSALLGVVLELGNVAPDALVLVDSQRHWVVLKNLEAINEAG